MAFLAHISMKSETNSLKAAIIKASAPIKKKVSFYYYRLAKGVQDILSYAKAESLFIKFFLLNGALYPHYYMLK
jgi:putative transposase